MKEQLCQPLLSDEATLRTYAQDYGRIIHKRPIALLRPSSTEEIVWVLRFARRNGLRVAARGQGHQPFGQAQIEGGVVIDMRSMKRIHSVTADRLEIEAGASWRSVVEASMGHESTPPVLPAYLELTVGGTLSIGGLGIASCRRGAQVDHVLELEVVTGNGDVVECSHREHTDLFEAALAGQGQCAIITRAALRLVPTRLVVREFVARYADSATLLEDAHVLAQTNRADGAVAVITPTPHGWSFALIATRRFTPPSAPGGAELFEELRPLAGSLTMREESYLHYVDQVQDIPAESHADLGLFVPGSAAARYLREILPRLTADDLGAIKTMRVFPLCRGSFTRPLFRVPNEERFVYIAMLRAETTDPRTLARMLAGNRTLFEYNRSLGGTLYPFSALRLTPRDWREHYGESYEAFLLAKRRHDPGNVIASGPDALAPGSVSTDTD